MEQTAVRRGTRKAEAGFFLWSAGLLFLLVLVGFAPTYFLKPLFDTRELPLRVHLHGVLFTGWFILFVVQAILVARREVRLHRRLGLASAVLAPAMVVSGLIILYFRALAYHDARSDPGTTADLVGTSVFVWGNLALLAAFATFVGLGIRFRSRPTVHKRLMLLASLSMCGQPLGRIGRWPVLAISDSTFANEAIYGLGGLVVLLLTLVAYDRVTRRRPHPATLWGSGSLLLAIVVGALLLPATKLGQALILVVG